MCVGLCVCIPILAYSFPSLEFPSSDRERAVAKEGNPRPQLGKTEGYMQANVEFDKGVCANKEIGIFTSSASSVCDED